MYLFFKTRLQVKAESSTQQTNNAEDLEAQMEEFLKRQQEAESAIFLNL